VGCEVTRRRSTSALAGRDINLERWLFSYPSPWRRTPTPSSKGRLLKPRIIHRRFDHSPYPNEAVIEGSLGA
jgi:hypothetical protein